MDVGSLGSSLNSALHAARDAAAQARQSVAAHSPLHGVETCPTCLSYGGEPLPGDPPADELATCPTCGVASVEWTLATQIDETVDHLGGFDHLLRVLDEEP